MEIVLMIKVFSQNNMDGLQYTKNYNSDSVPAMGSKIKDSLFAEFKTISDIVFDYSSEQCFVYLESKEVPDDRLEGHIQEVAEMHNWKEIKKED